MRIPKKYKIDTSGKSRAIFLNKNNNFFNKTHLSFLKKYYTKQKKEIRICLHQSKKSNLQVMVNLIILKKKYQIHYHNYSSEYYLPLNGKIRLVKFNSKNIYKEHIDVDGKKNIIGKIIRGEKHVAIPKGKFCIYLEFRSGSFNQHKNIFMKKFVSSKQYLKKK